MDRLPTSFISTRGAVHTLAEHVLCAARYAAVGRIGLTPVRRRHRHPPVRRPVVGLRLRRAGRHRYRR